MCNIITIDEVLSNLRDAIHNHNSNHDTTFVTLSYAQSIDGSIAMKPGKLSVCVCVYVYVCGCVWMIHQMSFRSWMLIRLRLICTESSTMHYRRVVIVELCLEYEDDTWNSWCSWCHMCGYWHRIEWWSITFCETRSRGIESSSSYSRFKPSHSR